MLDQGPDELPDPKEWLDDFTSRLARIGNFTGSNSAPPSPSVPGLLGSREDLDAIANAVNGQSDPTASLAAGAAKRPPATPAALPSYSVPSPHAGHYATLDEAANAASSDVPKNPYWEYGAYLAGRYVPEVIDLGDGFGPQPISHVDGYDYGGLFTSRNTGQVNLGPYPSHLGGWFHNHPWENHVNNDDNERPSLGPGKDEPVIKNFNNKQPQVYTYIQGPDGVLRKFWGPYDKGEIVK
jgi:hypothetical protein